MTYMFRLLHAAGAAAVAIASLVVFGTASAQPYPSRPVRIVIPYSPGGVTDAVARLVATNLSQKFGQSFFIENKPGADSALGTSFVAKSAPDGYTLLFTNDATYISNPVFFPSLSYDANRDLVPVAAGAYANIVLVVPASLPVNNFREFVAYTKANPGKLSYGSPGVGGQVHLAGEMYKKLTGTDLTHVPYKGTGQAMTDVVGGRLTMGFGGIGSVIAFVKDGRLKPLAITGDKRSPLLPDVPTYAELGFKDMDIGAWNAFFVPAGTPTEVVVTLNQAINEALSGPEAVKDLAGRGLEPMRMTPEQLSAFIKSEQARMAGIIKSSGVKPE